MKFGGFSKNIMLITAILLIATVAWAIPGIPHQFYGDVLINGESAPNGTVIKAVVNNQEYTVTTSNGAYGFSPNLLFVQDPNNDNNAKTIEFFINNEPATTYTFENGGYTVLDLEITTSSPAPPPASEPPPATGGGGGGGGGSGDPYESRLLRVSPTRVQVGEEVIFSALCKWSFGCTIETEGSEVADMVRSSGFQGFSHSYSTPGTKTVKLFHTGTNPTLVSEKTVTVTEEIVEVPKEEGNPVEPNDTGNETPSNQSTGNVDNTLAPPQDKQEEPEETPPTGFFSLGGFELDGMGQLGLGLLLFLLIALLISYNVKKNNDRKNKIKK